MSLSIPFFYGWLLNIKAARVEVNVLLAFLYWVGIALHPRPLVSDVAIFVLKGDVKLPTNCWKWTADCCIRTSDIARRQHLRSAGCRQLFVPWHRRSMFSFYAGGHCPETRHQTIFEIRHVFWQFLSWPNNFSRFTSIHSALEALRLCAI